MVSYYIKFLISAPGKDFVRGPWGPLTLSGHCSSTLLQLSQNRYSLPLIESHGCVDKSSTKLCHPLVSASHNVNKSETRLHLMALHLSRIELIAGLRSGRSGHRRPSDQDAVAQAELCSDLHSPYSQLWASILSLRRQTSRFVCS